MGYNTSPLVAVMLTLFNLRLGLWLGNPMSGKARRLLAARPRPAERATPVAPAVRDASRRGWRAVGAADGPPARGFASQPGAASAADALDTVARARAADPPLREALADPRYAAHRRGNPTLAAWPLIRELVGFSNERGSWINLSDGGHFDNLGVYEAILRRCRLVVCVDATCDPGHDLHHLARVIRMLAVDLGVEVAPLTDDDAPPDAPASPFRLYRIDYPPLEPDAGGAGVLDSGDGLLLLVKPLMLGDEPPDVASYARAHPDFPNESTQDQFFGESQFESYRRLGLHIAQRLLEDPPACGGRVAAADLVERVLGTRPRR